MKKTERIEIEGEALDLKEGGERLSFSLTSNLLHGLADYTSCYSYSYGVPNSPRNRQILGQLLLPGANNRKVRQKLPCRYFRDGLELLSGSVYVSAATASEISLNMVFGLDSLRELVEGGKKIYELDWSDSPDVSVAENGAAVGLHAWVSGQPQPASFFTFANECYQGSIGDEYPKIPQATSINTMIGKIEAYSGVELEGLDGASNDFLQFAPEYRRAGEWSVASNKMTATGLHISGYSVGYYYGYVYEGLGLMDIKGFCSWQNTVFSTPELRATSTVKSIEYSLTNLGSVATEVFIMPIVGNDAKTTVYNLFGDSGTPNRERRLCLLAPGETVAGSVTPLQLGLSSDYQFLAVLTATLSSSVAVVSGSVKVTADFAYGSVSAGKLKAGHCLPDLTLAEFLTQYAQVRFGKFAVNGLRGGNTIRFKSLEEVGAATPYDWSDKLLADGMRHSYSLDDLARKNWLNFGSDDSEAVFDEGYYNRAYPTNDATLEAEADFSEVSFSYSYRPAGAARMLTWAYGEVKSPAPRIVTPVSDVAQYSPHSDTDTTAYMAYESPILYWLGSNNAMARTMYEPNVVECSVQLSPVDLYTLDLARPVYLRQFGKLFYIDSADIDGDNIAELKLVELKQ